MNPRSPGFMRSWGRTLALGLLGGVLIGLVVGAALVVLLDLRAPVQARDVREVDGVALRGGCLGSLFHMDRAPGRVDATAPSARIRADVDGRRVRMFVPLGAATSGVLPVAGENRRFAPSVPIPSDLAEGRWHHRFRAVDACPGLLQFPPPAVRETPDGSVRVVARAAAPPLGPPPVPGAAEPSGEMRP